MSGGVGCSALLLLSPQCCPYSTARGQQVHETSAFLKPGCPAGGGRGEEVGRGLGRCPQSEVASALGAPPAPPFRGVAERAVPDTWVPGLHFPSLVGEVTCKKGKGVVCRGNRRVVWEPGREVDSKGARARAEAMEETSELEKQNRP